MAYTPINWQTGDTITAEKMNKMDNGWSAEISTQTLCEESVTTQKDAEYPDDPAVGSLVYSTQILADSITVTFNGTDYTCPKIDADGDIFYGGFNTDSGYDFTNYPFAVGGFTDGNMLFTENGGTYSIKIVASSSSVEISDEFSDVCNRCVDTSMMPMLCVSGTTTQAEIGNAFESGKLCFFKPFEEMPTIHIITSISSGVISFIPTASQVTASFVNGIFTVSV